MVAAALRLRQRAQGAPSLTLLSRGLCEWRLALSP